MNYKAIIENTEKNGEINEINNLNQIELFLEILRENRFDLLKNINFNFDIEDSNQLDELITLLFDYELWYYVYEVNKYKLSETLELRIIDQIINKKSDNENIFTNFIHWIEKINKIEWFIQKYNKILREKLKNNDYLPNELINNETMIKMIFERNKGNYIDYYHINEWSSETFKLFLKNEYDKINLNYINKIIEKMNFELEKNNISKKEFFVFLSYMNNKLIKERDPHKFVEKYIDEIIEKHSDYIFNCFENEKELPISLILSNKFRDECIKRKRFDLAVQCLLPKDLMNNEELIKEYIKELNLTKIEFYSIYKFINKYYEMNNDIFDSILATSLKKDITNLKIIHYERMINDPFIQKKLATLSKKELSVVTNITNRFSYDEYDITNMIANIITNIKEYNELINNININEISNEELNSLINILQYKENKYKTTKQEDLKKYSLLKEIKYLESISQNKQDINKSKDYLLKYLFNLSLKRAMRINQIFCYDNHSKNILDNIKKELPQNIFSILETINSIIETNDIEKLNYYYENCKKFENSIPLEDYLRSEYTKLYKNSLYTIKKDDEEEIVVNGEKVKIFFPKENDNLLIHVIGTCSDINHNTNYQKNWEDFPRMRDHIVACSLINNNKVNLRELDKIILGYCNIENAAIYYMSDSDIDSLDHKSVKYDVLNNENTENRKLMKMYPPLFLLEKTVGYNEIVTERRNYKGNSFKRKPDYIIVPELPIENKFYKPTNKLIKEYLSFLTEEDKIKLVETKEYQFNNPRFVKNILKNYTKEQIINFLSLYNEDAYLMNEEEIVKSFNNIAKNLIHQGRTYEFLEESIKAAKDFKIPIVVLNRPPYLEKKDINEKENYNRIKM